MKDILTLHLKPNLSNWNLLFVFWIFFLSFCSSKLKMKMAEELREDVEADGGGILFFSLIFFKN